MDERNSTDLALVVLNSFAKRGESVEKEIKEMRRENSSKYIVNSSQVRFGNGEGKLKINETIRGKDVYIVGDIGNYSVEYKMFGQINHMSPDDHFQDFKRAISAINGKARRITVIMPLLYSSRQHKRSGRESLDCAMALQELHAMGVHSIITFDAHDPNIQNAIPNSSFDSVYPTYPILKQFIADHKKDIDKEKMIIISPDTGAMGRAIFYANLLGLDVGMFYKRRDYSVIVNGKNPIVEHVYTGRDVKGKTVVIVDDMIASGESVLDIAKELKQREAKNVIVIASFAFFNEGIEKFEKLHNEGVITKVYSTNLSYIRPEVKNAAWFTEVDLTRFVALIIDTLNKEQSISPLLDSQDKIKKLLSSF